MYAIRSYYGGTYRVEADLTDDSGKTLASASWSGTDGQVSLTFEALLTRNGPYQIRDIYLYNADGRLIDTAGEDPEENIYTIDSLYFSGLTGLNANNTSVINTQSIDIDGDGDYRNNFV